MSSTAKQKIYNKLGINENALKSNTLFSPQANQKKSVSNYDNSKLNKGEKAIKFFTTANTDKKRNSLGTSAYQNFKIDILVPNNEPPKPLISLDTAKNMYQRANTGNGNKFTLPTSPFKSTLKDLSYTINSAQKNNKANNSHLENLNSSMKLSNTDVYSPVVRAKKKHDTDMTSKFFKVNFFLF